MSADVRVVTDLAECRRLWETFSPQRTLWELWDTCMCFFDEADAAPYFLVIMDDGKEKGILPLSLWKKSNTYYFFEGEYLEDFTFWFDLQYFPLVEKHIPVNTVFYDMNGKAVEELISRYPNYACLFRQSDYRYYIDLRAFQENIENYLATFNKKHRKNFLYDLRKLTDHKYTLVWEKLEHFDDFVAFNVKRFGEESDFVEEHFTRTVHALFSYLEQQGFLLTLSVFIEGRLVGIEISAFFQGIYYIMNGGYDRSVENIGKLLIWEHIKKATTMQAEEVNLLVGDTGWKRLWNCSQAPVYEFSKR